MCSGQPLMQNLAGELLRVKDAYEREELVTVPRTTLSRIETDQAFLCSQVYSIIGRNYIYELDAWTGAVEGLSLWSRDRGLTLRAQQSSKTSRTYCPRAESQTSNPHRLPQSRMRSRLTRPRARRSRLLLPNPLQALRLEKSHQSLPSTQSTPSVSAM